MRQGILGNIWVCQGPYLPESGTSLHISGRGNIEWQPPERKKDFIRQIGGINNGDVGDLRSCLGSGDDRFGYDVRRWAGTSMEQSDWEILGKEKF